MMPSVRRAFAWSAIAIAGCLIGCTTKDPLYCDASTPCVPGKVCNLVTRTCEPAATGDARSAERSSGELGAGDRAPGEATSKLSPGDRCQSGGECGSGFCVEGVCCENACSESPTCAGGMQTLWTCSSGACVSAQRTCGGYACDTGGKCKTSCLTTSADCVGTAQCDGSHTCVSSLPLGDPCGTNNDACASKHCVDGVCCDSDCTGTCMRCNLSGTVGQCKPVPDKQDPDKECQGADPVHCSGYCNGAGACNLSVKDGTSCATDQCSGVTLTKFSCASGTCAPSSAPCPNYFACDSAANTCKVSCTKATQAADCAPSYSCTDGVCCQVASCGACKRCNLAPQGTCVAVPDGTTADCEKGECAGSCKSGSCDFSSSNGTTCGTNTCNPPGCTGHSAGTCDQGYCALGVCC
jgi:hypothetical protein